MTPDDLKSEQEVNKAVEQDAKDLAADLSISIFLTRAWYSSCNRWYHWILIHKHILNNIIGIFKMPGTVRVLLENLKREQEVEKKRLAEREVAKKRKIEYQALH